MKAPHSRKPVRDREPATRGSLLISAMLISAVVGLGLAASIKLSFNSLRLAQRTFYLNDAANLAEAGLEEAVHCFRLVESGTATGTAWQHWEIAGGNATRTLPSFDRSQSAVGVVKVFVLGYNSTTAATVYAQATITPLDQSAPVVKTLKISRAKKTSGGSGTRRRGRSSGESERHEGGEESGRHFRSGSGDSSRDGHEGRKDSGGGHGDHDDDDDDDDEHRDRDYKSGKDGGSREKSGKDDDDDDDSDRREHRDDDHGDSKDTDDDHGSKRDSRGDSHGDDHDSDKGEKDDDEKDSKKKDHDDDHRSSDGDRHSGRSRGKGGSGSSSTLTLTTWADLHGTTESANLASLTGGYLR